MSVSGIYILGTIYSTKYNESIPLYATWFTETSFKHDHKHKSCRNHRNLLIPAILVKCLQRLRGAEKGKYRWKVGTVNRWMYKNMYIHHTHVESHRENVTDT